MLSKGRLRLGMGRGLARREFAAFRLSMDESRERFDEAAPMIVNALKTGFIEGDGKYYKQPRIEIRPRPQHSFDGRIYAVASSEDSSIPPPSSAPIWSCSPTGPGRCALPVIERGRELHRKYHGTEPPHVMLTEFCVCGTNLADDRGGGAQVPGQIRREQFLSLRIPGRALQDGERLRLLPAEGRDRAQGRARRRGQRLHAGRELGHARQDPARARSSAGRSSAISR